MCTEIGLYNLQTLCPFVCINEAPENYRLFLEYPMDIFGIYHEIALDSIK